MAIGTQIHGTIISGIVNGDTLIFMGQELNGWGMYMVVDMAVGPQIETPLFILILVDLIYY